MLKEFQKFEKKYDTENTQKMFEALKEGKKVEFSVFLHEEEEHNTYYDVVDFSIQIEEEELELLFDWQYDFVSEIESFKKVLENLGLTEKL